MRASLLSVLAGAMQKPRAMIRQERVGALGGPKRSWRMIARGFCIAPASTLNGDARILVSRFDFAGNAVFE